jgi:hypothetical protein
MFRLIKKRIAESAVFIFGKTPFAAAVTVVLFALCLMPASAKADVVTDWNEIGNTAVVTNAKRPAGAAIVDMAYVHAAIYDAVNAIDHRYTSYAVSPNVAPLPQTSKEAAASTAAYKVLLALFPAQETFLTTKYTQYLAAIPDEQPKIDGIALGNEIATKFLRSRVGDGRDAVVPFTPWTGIGNWQPTPPAFAPTPLTPWMAMMRPFLIDSPSQFRAEGPPALGSEQWAIDYNETKNYGALNNSLRTPEQTEIGLFYTEHTGAQYNRIFRQFAQAQNLNVADNARLFAMIYLAGADSLIAGWDSKFYFHFWRPVTAIRNGELDGNPLTLSNADWTPLTPTPGHPEYPAAHGCLTAAFAEALHAFYGTKKVTITLSSTATNTTRTFENTDDLTREIIDARVFGGMHYRTSVRHGAVIGKKVVKWMSKNFFQPVP